MNPILAKQTGTEFDSMVDRGAFDCIEGKKVELIAHLFTRGQS